MDRRYQVFASSTFEDLREERAAVIGALLQMDCFPTGMELFPASDEDSWTLIQRVIDDSDYYLVVLGGRYGTVPDGETRSFTHREYDYALSIGKPTIALLHRDPETLPVQKSETSDVGTARLREFRESLQKKNCRFWTGTGELTSAIFTGIQNLKKIRPVDGWVRGADLPDPSLKDEVIRLRREIDSLNKALDIANSQAAPEGTEQLATSTASVSVRWDNIMRAVLSHTHGAGASRDTIASALAALAHEAVIDRKHSSAAHGGWPTATLSPSDFAKVMNQMVALGLVTGVEYRTSSTRWKATPYGAQTGAKLLAIKSVAHLF